MPRRQFLSGEKWGTCNTAKRKWCSGLLDSKWFPTYSSSNFSRTMTQANTPQELYSAICFTPLPREKLRELISSNGTTFVQMFSNHSHWFSLPGSPTTVLQRSIEVNRTNKHLSNANHRRDLIQEMNLSSFSTKCRGHWCYLLKAETCNHLHVSVNQVTLQPRPPMKTYLLSNPSHYTDSKKIINISQKLGRARTQPLWSPKAVPQLLWASVEIVCIQASTSNIQIYHSDNTIDVHMVRWCVTGITIDMVSFSVSFPARFDRQSLTSLRTPHQ